MGDSSKATFGRGQLFDETELNYISTALIDEMLMRTKNLVRVPGVFLPNGTLTDNNLKASVVDADTVAVAAGVAVDDLGQLIEVPTATTVAISAGTYALILLWSYTDGTVGTFETGYGPGYTRRSRSYSLTLTAWPNVVAHSILLAKIDADGINPVVVTDARTGALLHWALIDWEAHKSSLADAILQQGVPAVRLDAGTGSSYFYCYEKPGSSGAKMIVCAGHGLDASGNVLKISIDFELAVADDNTYHQVQIYPSATYGGESTVLVVGDGSTGGFYAARVKRNGTTLTISDMRTRLWMRSMTDDANTPATPTHLRLCWGFENQQRQRGELDGFPSSGHMQGALEPIWVKARIGDGGTGVLGGTAYEFTKTMNELGAWTTNEWAGHSLLIAGHLYAIVSNTATKLTVSTLLPLQISGTVAFDIVPGGTMNFWNLQSKLPTEAVIGGEVEEVGAVMAPTEELTAGYYTAKTNSTWIESQVFQSGTIPQTSIDLLEGSARRVMIFHNLPATVPYRVRVQARGGASSDYWSAWSDWVIIKPMAPDAQRVYLNPSTNIIRIEPQPGIIRVAIDWSAGTSPVKAAADRYFAGMLITYTEGESLSGLSQLSKNPAATPVPLVPWKNISSRTGGQITVMTPDNCVTLPVEPLCHARIVLQVILRDGTLSAPMEVGYESGAVICVSPRGVADGQGTQPPSFNDLVNSGGSIAGGYNGVTIVPIHAFIPEVNGTTPTWQLVDSFYLGMYYDNYGDIPADIYIRLVGLRVNAKLAAYNAWSVRVTVAGSPAKVYTLTMVPSGVGGWLPLDEVLHLPDYNHVTIEVQVAPGGSQTATSVQVALVTRLEPNYIPPSA